jgi:(2R)-3-sulfolactate dehydrogenase (NADP+)
LPLSKVTKGKIMVGKQKQVSVPKEWAVYLFGQPTTDPDAALSGTMLPMGEAKGATLVLIVEVLSAARTASHFGFEASSSFLLKVLPPRGWPVAYRVCAKSYI